MPNDLLVKLYNVEDNGEAQSLARQGIRICRPMALDKARVLQFVKENFYDGWMHECEYAFTAHPITCFVAIYEKKVVGFACYDVTRRGIFGPIGVLDSMRGKGVGTALLKKCMLAMKEEGYGYAVIGWVDEALEFYRRTVGAEVIADSFPGVYKDMIGM